MAENFGKNIGFPRDFIDKVVDSTDVAAIVGKFTALKRAGKKLIGLCPFHQEKTPSFSVDADKGLFYCFGCGKGGNIISFVMEKEGLSFPEAIEFLAREAGLPIPVRRAAFSENEAQTFAVESAVEFYSNLLFSSEAAAARAYLKKRGIDENFAKNFGFGFAPDAWDALKNYATDKKLSTSVFVKCGLFVENERGHIYDRFRNGLIIPIRNSAGRAIALAVRSFSDGDGPKYINSPESTIYNKSETLFGLDEARKHIRNKEFAILVEGYFDVISLWRAGFGNAIASCGTALTMKHAFLLRRFTDRVIIFYDGDAAGLSATFKALEPLLRTGFLIRIARPPQDTDPDDVARTFTIEEITKLFDEALDWFDYAVAITKSTKNWNTIEGKLRFVQRLAPFFADIEDELSRALYTKRMAQVLEVPEAQIKSQLDKTPTQAHQNLTNTATATHGLSKLESAELDCLAVVLKNALLADYIRNEEFRFFSGLRDVILACVDGEGECTSVELTPYVSTEVLSYLTYVLENFKHFPTMPDLQKHISARNKLLLDAELNDIDRKMQAANDAEKEALLQRKYELKRLQMDLQRDF